jgi:hypothetical protein
MILPGQLGFRLGPEMRAFEAPSVRCEVLKASRVAARLCGSKEQSLSRRRWASLGSCSQAAERRLPGQTSSISPCGYPCHRPLDRSRVPSFGARIPLLGKFSQRTRSRRKKRMSWARFGSEIPRSPEGTCGTALESICRAVLEKLIPRWQLAFRTQVEVFHRAFPQEALRDRHGTKYT